MAVIGIFYHSNFRTPRWLGFLIQHAEMHTFHHELNVHGRNYGDISIWDLCCGTFHNPQLFAGRLSFEDGRELRFLDLLIGRNVNSTKKKHVLAERLES